MANDPSLRAGDGDRDRTIAELRQAFTEGRLTEDEFQQRLDAAAAARTYGDLDALTRDLPSSPPVVPDGTAYPPVPVTAATPPAPVDDRRRNLRAGWASWAGVSLLCTVIWLATVLTSGSGDSPSFWPIWVIGPWGAVMVLATLNRNSRD